MIFNYPLRLTSFGTSPARGEVKSAPFTGELAFAKQMTEGVSGDLEKLS